MKKNFKDGGVPLKKKDYELFLSVSGVKQRYIDAAVDLLENGRRYNGESRQEREKHLSMLMLNKYIALLDNGAEADMVMEWWNSYKKIDTRIKGDFHVHTVFSDGADTVETMVREAARIGYKWIVLSDHSPVEGNPFRLDEDKFSRFMDEAEGVREKTGMTVYRAVEADISETGELMIPDRWRKQLDFVIASLHESISDYDDALKRIDSATKDPLVRIFAHPFFGLDKNYDRSYIDSLLRILNRNSTAVEFNLSPRFLMNNIELMKVPAVRETETVFSTDSHFVGNLYLMRFASLFMDNAGGAVTEKNLNLKEKIDL